MTKEELKQYQHIKRELEKLERTIQRINEDLYSPRTSNLTGMPKSQLPDGFNPADSWIEEKSEVLEMYARKKEELKAALLAIENAIATLEPAERTVMRLHYIDGLKWEQVCVEAFCSWRTAHRYHARALEKLKEVRT